MHHPDDLPFGYSQITKYLYIGTNKCCAEKKFVKELLKKGIRADISLERERIDSPFGVKFYLWLPTQEHKPLSVEQLLAGGCFLKSLTDQKIKTYIHCEHGHSRSLTFVACFLILTQRMNIKEAINFVKEKRPQVHINPIQKKALEKFERLVRKGLKICRP